MKKVIPVFSILFVFAVINSFALDVNKKFGKVSVEELLNDVCPIDSNAHAYYIFDEGYTSYSYIEGFQVIFIRHFRIKILDSKGLDNAEFEIPIYSYGRYDESMGRIKAETFNLEKGNKIVRQKISKKSIYREEASKYYTNIKFALPNVKPGSVIEVEYRITSKRIGKIPSWDFQHFIPVLSTDYNVKVPEYFYFNQTLRGYYSVNNKRKYSNGSINFKDGTSLNYTENAYEFSYENMPAFPVGEYLSTPDNYKSNISFEISRYEIPGVVYESYNTSWDDVKKLFLEDSDFGERLKFTRFLNDEAENIKSKNVTDYDILNDAFTFVKAKTIWNERSSCWASQSLKNTLDEGEGNSADINLLLVALLERIGLKAYPVALSTRSNGIIHPTHASISQLNYVICLCVIEGENYLLDATEKYAPVNILPTRCLNGKGRIISENLSDWVWLLSGNKDKYSIQYDLSLNDSDTFDGSMKIINKEFSAFYKRNLISDFESEQKYVDDLVEDNPGLIVNDFLIEGFDSIDKDISLLFEVEIKDKAESMGDLLIFNPLFFNPFEKNPLSLEKREYPVEYPQPISEQIVAKVEIPDSYVVESVPEEISVNALSGKTVFTYTAKVQGSSIWVISNFTISETIFPASDYEYLKEFYEVVVKKQQEKVVLKKKAN